ncbi:hypothetical protein ABZV34_02665 [Streptomyces sp. NPDC005195]
MSRWDEALSVMTWRSARMAVLPPHAFETPTGQRVYDNRHTRLTK